MNEQHLKDLEDLFYGESPMGRVAFKPQYERLKRALQEPRPDALEIVRRELERATELSATRSHEFKCGEYDSRFGQGADVVAAFKKYHDREEYLRGYAHEGKRGFAIELKGKLDAALKTDGASQASEPSEQSAVVEPRPEGMPDAPDLAGGPIDRENIPLDEMVKRISVYAAQCNSWASAEVGFWKARCLSADAELKYQQQRAEQAELRAEAERKDAERYRWLRENCQYGFEDHDGPQLVHRNGETGPHQNPRWREQLDAAIDAARERRKG